MQEPGGGPGGGPGGAVGAPEGEEGRDRPPAAEERDNSGSSSADDDDDRDDAAPEQGGPPDALLVAPADPEEGRPVEQGVAGEEVAVAPQGEQPPLASGPSGDAATASGSRLMEFCVMVHFRSPLEADMARRSLVSNAPRREETIQQEFTVINSVLAVRWMTEDPAPFRMSINNFLDQLALVMRNIQRLELVAIAQRGRGIRRPES